MKIAWFSPRVPEHTEIAKNTERLESELTRRFDARFFSEQPTGFHEPAADRMYAAPLGHIPPELLTTLNEVDVPFYNLGNNPAFFAKTWFLNQYKPGVIILHDLKLHHFFEGIYRDQMYDQPQYLAFMREYYGEPGVTAGKLYWKQQLFIDFMAENFPMTAWGVRNALAVVTHTQPTLDAVTEETGLPAVLSTLPYNAHPTLRRTPPAAGSRARIAIFGYLNVNRRVIEFFHALAAMEERARFEVHIFGSLWQTYEDNVKHAVSTLGLRDQVIFHGYVTEEALDAGLADCDLAVNLRYPTMGEASASQLRIWDHALPSLVTRTGGYAAMPESAVCFVRPDHEGEDIQRHLRAFLTDPARFRGMGLAGREILLREHQPSTYVERLVRLCEHLPDLRSRHNRLRLADSVAGAVAAWTDAATPGREPHYAGAITELL